MLRHTILQTMYLRSVALRSKVDEMQAPEAAIDEHITSVWSPDYNWAGRPVASDVSSFPTTRPHAQSRTLHRAAQPVPHIATGASVPAEQASASPAPAPAASSTYSAVGSPAGEQAAHTDSKAEQAVPDVPMKTELPSPRRTPRPAPVFPPCASDPIGRIVAAWTRVDIVTWLMETVGFEEQVSCMALLGCVSTCPPLGALCCVVMSCHVMSCHVMSCHVMSCDVM